jgi:GDP-L-fucose synthase
MLKMQKKICFAKKKGLRHSTIMNKDSRIYVAGHNGLVGSALVRMLESKGYKNIIKRTSKELDIRRQAEIEKLFEKERPEYIFLAAAKVGGILANSTFTAEFIYDNIMIAANIVQASYKYDVKKLLNLGSSCIYPKYATQPMKEEYLLTGLLEPTNEPYAIAKISAIKLCRYYNEQYGTNFMSVMPTNLYGPDDNFDFETSHVLPALIRKMYIAKCMENRDFNSLRKDLEKFPIRNLSPKDLTDSDIINLFSDFGIIANEKMQVTVKLWGSGKPYREFLYVNDLADACIFIMENYDYKQTGEFFNIGTGKEIKIKDLAKLIKDIIGFKGNIDYDHTKPDGTPRKLLDVSKIQSFGWQPKTSLEEGIKKVCALQGFA